MKPRVASPVSEAPATAPPWMAVAYADGPPSVGRRVVMPSFQTNARPWKSASRPLPTTLPSLPMP
ncbi:hypothetical protein IA69_08225 [Massilia sp. JS1662]|nr:hypothetical protein [Massilia sp. JS1662]KGF82308.1 hypothetical protein IA69_08225 [Massilia sp. JS1662]